MARSQTNELIQCLAHPHATSWQSIKYPLLLLRRGTLQLTNCKHACLHGFHNIRRIARLAGEDIWIPCPPIRRRTMPRGQRGRRFPAFGSGQGCLRGLGRRRWNWWVRPSGAGTSQLHVPGEFGSYRRTCQVFPAVFGAVWFGVMWCTYGQFSPDISFAVRSWSSVEA